MHLGGVPHFTTQVHLEPRFSERNSTFATELADDVLQMISGHDMPWNFAVISRFPIGMFGTLVSEPSNVLLVELEDGRRHFLVGGRKLSLRIPLRGLLK